MAVMQGAHLSYCSFYKSHLANERLSQPLCYVNVQIETARDDSPVLSSLMSRTAAFTPCTSAIVHDMRSRCDSTLKRCSSTPCLVPDRRLKVRSSFAPVDCCFPECTSLVKKGLNI